MHSQVSTGEEGITIGSAAALGPDDIITCQYRETGVFQQRGFTLKRRVKTGVVSLGMPPTADSQRPDDRAKASMRASSQVRRRCERHRTHQSQDKSGNSVVVFSNQSRTYSDTAHDCFLVVCVSTIDASQSSSLSTPYRALALLPHLSFSVSRSPYGHAACPESRIGMSRTLNLKTWCQSLRPCWP